jgi:transcriptional regulator with XRE-family HTH domain
MTSLGQRIKELRLERNLSIEQAANDMDPRTTGKTLSKWERGIENPQIENFIALARFFNVDADYLLGWSEERKPQTLNKQAAEMLGLNEARKISGAGERRASRGAAPRRRVDNDQ